MKKTMLALALVFAFLMVPGCAQTQSGPVAVKIDSPVTFIEQLPEATTEPVEAPEFNYILAKEADYWYLHKVESWTESDGTVIFSCPICGNVVCAPRTNILMYQKVTLETAWADYANVCGGEAGDWHELLGG